MISVVIRLDWNIEDNDRLYLKNKFDSLEAAEAFMQSAAASSSFLEAYYVDTPEQSMYVNVKHVAYFTCRKRCG